MQIFLFRQVSMLIFIQRQNKLSIVYVYLQYNPATGIIVEVQNLNVQLYSIVLKIYAKFTGLRYVKTT